jgi:hypothetical protein
MPKQVSLT